MYIHVMRQAAYQKNQELPSHEPDTSARLRLVDTFGGTGPEDIMERYRKGNLYERLNLWLTHRDMRSVLSGFDETER
ncbi:hypothetical protein FAK_16540 [Desulfoferula mesophila]|uniref:Transposase n=1 Tax=Desulfoferula mesophila TaxID=3058419 RepID=A0AAU9EBX1_9BACT|nr:hypothetical protein FAK_16540 [Desulfoferula mesophilus]